MDDDYIVQSSKDGAISTVPVTKLTEVENSISCTRKLLIKPKKFKAISPKPIIALQISEQLSRIS